MRTETPDSVTGPLDNAATVLSVEKALAVVELLMRDAAPLTARDISERLGLNRTTVHRLLNALAHRGWIEKPAKSSTYRLSLKFLALAHLTTHYRDFLAEVKPTLDELAELSRETVHLGVLDGHDVVHIDKVESPELVGVSSKIGSRGVPHTTALGRALLAASPDAALDDYLCFARGRTDRYRVADEARVRAEIARTRERGYSLDDEEDSIGVRCLGVALRGAGGEAICAVSLTGPSPRFTRARATALAPALIATAENVSRRFGWEPDFSSTHDGKGK